MAQKIGHNTALSIFFIIRIVLLIKYKCFVDIVIYFTFYHHFIRMVGNLNNIIFTKLQRLVNDTNHHDRVQTAPLCRNFHLIRLRNKQVINENYSETTRIHIISMQQILLNISIIL